MSTSFNDAGAWLNGQGGLSLGNAGFDDFSGDPAAPYAKGDCFINVPLEAVAAFVQAATLSRISAGIYALTLAAGATTGIIAVPLVGIFRKFISARGGVQNPHGLKVLDLVFGYTIATLAPTSIGVTFATEVQTPGIARAANTAPFGAVTYQTLPGTVVGTPPVVIQATPYVVKATPAAPVFISVDNTEAFAEISVVNPGTAVFALTHVGFHASVAIY